MPRQLEIQPEQTLCDDPNFEAWRIWKKIRRWAAGSAIEGRALELCLWAWVWTRKGGAVDAGLRQHFPEPTRGERETLALIGDALLRDPKLVAHIFEAARERIRYYDTAKGRAEIAVREFYLHEAHHRTKKLEEMAKSGKIDRLEGGGYRLRHAGQHPDGRPQDFQTIDENGGESGVTFSADTLRNALSAYRREWKAWREDEIQHCRKFDAERGKKAVL